MREAHFEAETERSRVAVKKAAMCRARKMKATILRISNFEKIAVRWLCRKGPSEKSMPVCPEVSGIGNFAQDGGTFLGVASFKQSAAQTHLEGEPGIVAPVNLCANAMSKVAEKVVWIASFGFHWTN